MSGFFLRSNCQGPTPLPAEKTDEPENFFELELPLPELPPCCELDDILAVC